MFSIYNQLSFLGRLDILLLLLLLFGMLTCLLQRCLISFPFFLPNLFFPLLLCPFLPPFFSLPVSVSLEERCNTALRGCFWVYVWPFVSFACFPPFLLSNAMSTEKVCRAEVSGGVCVCLCEWVRE